MGVGAATLLTLCAWQSAQTGPVDREWTVEGDVTKDGVNVPKTVISGSGPTHVGIATDSNGHYMLKGSIPGNYLLVAGRDETGVARRKSVNVVWGTHLRGVDFALAKGAAISGRVLDADRKPVRGVTVMSWIKTFQDGRATFVSREWDETDDSGEFRIANLREGRYYLRASNSAMLKPRNSRRDPSGSRSERPPVTATQAAFYPNGRSQDGAAAIFLNAGEDREGADIILSRTPSFCVRGDVSVPADGAPLGASLWISTTADLLAGVAAGPVNPGEDFEICGLAPGQYTAIASTFDAAKAGDPKQPSSGFIRTEFTIAKRDAELGSLHPSPALPVHGRVIVRGARPEDPVPNGLIVDLNQRGRPIFAGEKRRAQVEASGEFAMERVFIDDYILRVSGLPKGYYVAEAAQQGRDVRQGDVRPGAGDLKVVLAPDGASISGQTVDKDRQPVPDIWVVLVPDNGAPLIAQQSDQAGQFWLGSVVPGDYRIVALGGLYDGEEQDPEVVRANLSDATELSVAPGSSVSASPVVRSVR